MDPIPVVNKKEVQSVSLNQKAWKRLKRNKAAVFGMLILAIAVFLTLFAYLIAPDSTKDAAEQIPQLETHAPGFTIDILKKTRDKKITGNNILKTAIKGKESRYELIPITEYRFEGNKIIIMEYQGENRPPIEKEIPLVDVAYALPAMREGVIQQNGEQISLTDVYEKQHSISISELQQQIEKKHIKSRTFLLGTDKFGRDVLSRLIVGVRVSVTVGLVSVFISLMLGVVLGALAGYFRGWVDEVVMWFINVFWSIPTLLLALSLYVAFGNSPLFESSKLFLIFIAVGLTMWVEMARIVRGQFLSIREKEFVEAANSLGYTHKRTIFKHILPNILGPVIVIAAANFANAILIESGLSFIGLGVSIPTPSWGAMLNEYRDYIGSDKSYLALFPGTAIMLLVLAFNLIGNGMRDALDVKTKTS